MTTNGPLSFDNETRTRILADVKVTIDPAASTVELKVDSTWYTATWQGSAVHTAARLASDGKVITPEYWVQTAQTTGYFAGPDVTASGATVLAVGRHTTEARVTSGQDIIVGVATPIVVTPAS